MGWYHSADSQFIIYIDYVCLSTHKHWLFNIQDKLWPFRAYSPSFSLSFLHTPDPPMTHSQLRIHTTHKHIRTNTQV